ncbi:MAG: fibronectin type III domain-containing protein [Gemmatimonadales bacterium]|nr:fibronectin type III domain-containing protein [Gemmatimonadales bacterium]
MSTSRITLIAAFLLTFLPALSIILGGCESNPAEPVFDNIFDPEGPELGDPLHVMATYSDTSITVIWDQPQDFGIAFYEISHSNSYGSGYEFFESVDHTDLSSGFLAYPNPEPTTEHYFHVLAITHGGDFLLASYQKPGSVITPPRVLMGDDNGSSPTRYLTLSITVSSEDELVLADNEDFENPLQIPVIEPGTAQEVTWDLGTAEANDEMKFIFVKALTGTTESKVFADSVKVDFQPAFSVNKGLQSAFTAPGDTAFVPTFEVDLDIPLSGVQRMRFALSAEALDNSTWLAVALPDSILRDFELVNTLEAQVIYGEFEGDFGFNSPIIEVVVSGDDLTDAQFSLDLGEAAFVDNPLVTLECSAVATEMRFSENPDFTDLAWMDYEDSHDFELNPGAGHKTIYGQFRNDFVDSRILVANINVYIEQSVAVWFLEPTDGTVLIGGTTLDIRGSTAMAVEGAKVDSVKIDLGNGEGFHIVELEEDLINWFLTWDVPVVEEETQIILRVRALADPDSATADISVTVIP